MNKNQATLRIGLLPPVADLYVRVWPWMCERLGGFAQEVARGLEEEGFDVVLSPCVSTSEQADAACRDMETEGIDLLLVAMAPYCPSGVLMPILSKIDSPILLWPVQSMYELDPAAYNEETIALNHGVHGVQDLANALAKAGKKFGVTHGHLAQGDFIEELKAWVRAGRAICAIRNANPLQIGGHFTDMLDLQIGEARFLSELKVKAHRVTIDEFAAALGTVKPSEVAQLKEAYQAEFEASDVSDGLLARTAEREAAVRSIMTSCESVACGLNFLELCNDKRIADALHVAASRLMNEGCGYAGEGDWVTASFVRGMQQAFGQASFTEMFSVGYADSRIILRHWGEGNMAMARSKPTMRTSRLQDKCPAEFAIADFEFESGPATLINLNSDADGEGRLISVCGAITADHLPNSSGPRGIFKPGREVRELLTEYAYAGGSHHLVLVMADASAILAKISRLTGWSYINL